MRIGDLVMINTKTLHFHEGKLGLILTMFELIDKEMWYTVFIEGDEYCFKHKDLEVIGGRED